MKTAVLISVVGVLCGCAATGENLKSNVYQAGQVNRVQEARSVQIISVLAAKIEVDNSQQKKQAQVGGATLGALAGGLGGGFGGLSGWGTAGTAAAGGVAGAAAGSLVPDTNLVDGVTIAYSEDERMFTSTQVGQKCEFKIGLAMIVSTGGDETRIQPNAECPVE